MSRLSLSLALALGAVVVWGGPAWADIASQTADATLFCDITTSPFPSPCSPAGVAVAPSGRLYVTDFSNSRVLSWPSAEHFTTGEAADLVLGQPDFTARGCNTGGVSARSLCDPEGLAVDPGGDLWVADVVNYRVLRYHQPRTNGQAAELVLGQPDFTTTGCNAPKAIPPGPSPTNQTLCLPAGVTVGRSGDLWVVDEGNQRVLRYERPRTNDQAADLVVGQPDFASHTRGCAYLGGVVSATSLCFPRDAAVDRSGDLWVSDRNSDRVLRYHRPRTNGQAADLVLGQPNFTTTGCNTGGVSAHSLCAPQGLAFDSRGMLYLADESNERVLRYHQPRTNDQAADLVVGQPNFSTRTCNAGGVSTHSLCSPESVALDRRGDLLVADGANHRVLRYDRSRSSGDGDSED